MPQSLQKVLADAKDAKFSSISTLSEDDLANLWNGVCCYIERQMANQKGVQIPHFGTFSFSQRTLDLGNCKCVVMQRPVFNISEKFAKSHGLQYNKYYVPGTIPCAPLNFAALAFETPFNRDTLESCVREVVSSLSRAIACKTNVELVFCGIGCLQIRENYVKMKFFKEFITSMDGTGNLLRSLQNRTGTADSVMSNRPQSRPNTATLILPKIQPSMHHSNTSPLPPLAEVDESHNAVTIDATHSDQAQHQSSQSQEVGGLLAMDSGGTEESRPREAAPVELFPEDMEMGDSNTNAAVDHIMESADIGQLDPRVFAVEEATQDVPEEKKAHWPCHKPGRTTMPLAQATGISDFNDLVPPSAKLSPAPPMEPRAATCAELPQGSGRGQKRVTLEPLRRSASLDNLPGSDLDKPPASPAPRAPPSPPDSACGHASAGQELCYLCHQRSRRNVYTSFAEERKKRQEEEDRLLQQFQAARDAEDVLREQERFIARRNDLQKISAFNLGVAEAVTSQKKAKDTLPQRSYVFNRRPETPSRLTKQEEYLRDLTKQVETKGSMLAKKKADEQFLERLEQVQLAEDLAAQREQYQREKQQHMSNYRNALDTQVRFKPVPLPPREADGEMFGKNDTTNEMLAEKRRRAQQLFQDQLHTVGQRKREALLRQIAEQQHDQQVLEHARQSVKDERAFRHKVRNENRRHLEEEWQRAGEAKRARDLEERLLGLESGNLLHEQCDRYRRCRQCQRQLANCGESNVWRESRYISGSRIMV